MIFRTLNTKSGEEKQTCVTVLSSLLRKKGRRLKFAHARSRQSQFGQWGGALRGIHREQKDAVQQLFESNGWLGMLKWPMWCETESTALSTSLEEERCCHIDLLHDFTVNGISMAPKVGQVFPYAACNSHSRFLFSLWTDPLWSWCYSLEKFNSRGWCVVLSAVHNVFGWPKFLQPSEWTKFPRATLLHSFKVNGTSIKGSFSRRPDACAHTVNDCNNFN